MRDQMFIMFWRRFFVITAASILVGCYFGLTYSSCVIGVISYLLSSGLLSIILIQKMLND